METVKYYVKATWTWLKGRQKATLAAGAVIGALTDDLILGLLRALF